MLWWDLQEKNPGSRKGVALSDQKGPVPKLADLGLDYLTVHRWRVRLKDDADFARVIQPSQV